MNRVIRFNQLYSLTLALFREIIREPGVLFWGIIFPILMTVGLGLAFTQKGDVTRKVALITDSGIYENPAIMSFLEEKGETNSEDDSWKYRFIIEDEKLGNSVFHFYEMNWDEAMKLLKRGTLNVLITATTDSIGYHFDPLNSDAELTWLKLSSVLGNSALPEIADETASEIKPLTVTGTRYIDFLVPGLITMGIMMSCMWGISYGIIEKRSKKLLRRLVATPMKKSHFLISLITVRIILNIIESLTLLVFALLVFKMHIQGDITALILVYLAGNVAFAGLAVFASSHTSNTEVGNGIINFIVMPMMVLSGIFFSYQNFPEWSHGFIKSLPLTTMTDSIRSIINEGSGLFDVMLPIVILTATGIVFFAAGLKIFKWH